MIIVIDGPAGSGKSTTARAVAEKLQIEYLDSGALYRTATLLYLEAEKNKDMFFRLLDQKNISFYYNEHIFHVEVNGDQVTDDIRTSEIVESVSEVAAMSEVRSFINNLMRKAVQDGKYVAEGRDLGTAVFPDADLKIYMWADLSERARRRYNERKKDNPDLTFEEVKSDIAERDKKDTNRDADPLKKAEDAIEIDTTSLTFAQQVNQIYKKAKQHLEI